MSADYRVEIDVAGSPAWVVVRGAEPIFPIAPEILDGLSLSWQMPDADVWPVQPEPTTLRFSILAATAAELAFLDVNTPIELRIYAGVEAAEVEVPSVRFAGKVTDLDGGPRRVEMDDDVVVNAWQLDVIAVDLVAALADENVAGNVDPEDTGGPYGWVWFYFTLAGITPPDWGTGGNGREMAPIASGKIPEEPLLTAVDRVLARYPDGGEVTGAPESDPANHALYDAYGWRRGILIPNIGLDGTLDEDTPYAIEWVARRSLSAFAGPLEGGTLAPADGIWSVVLTPPPATTWDPFAVAETDVSDFSLVISADYLDFGARWTRSKFLDANRILLTTNEPDSDWRKITRNAAAPRPDGYETVTAQLQDVRIIDADNVRHLGDMYVEDAYDHPNNRYQAQGFIWYASRDPQWPILRGLFPDNSLTSLWRGFSSPITITDIPPEQSPNGARWHTGTLKAAEWVFDRGEFNIALSLYPRIPRPARTPSDVIAVTRFTWVSTIVLPFSPTWDTLNTADTWLDYRIVRPLATDYPLGP